jgi:hypothetical protein
MLGFEIDPNSPTHRRRLIGQRSLLGRAPPTRAHFSCGLLPQPL